ncbi:Mcm3ap [Symbiodinium sp. CCMP2592]|nr:Mcm3ap [Symbiodinium sp. CCMP2592]
MTLVGRVEEMCSEEELRQREAERLLDPLEWLAGSEPRAPKADKLLTTKKYQRSAAGKVFAAEEVRSLQACTRTMLFLMTQVLSADVAPETPFVVTPSLEQAAMVLLRHWQHMEVYAYLRDRSRAVRQDLHLQQPLSGRSLEFVECHEYCLRFEMLALFLLSPRLKPGKGSSQGGYSRHLGLQAISQTIDPLLAAYREIRCYQGADAELRNEPAIQRFVVLLLLASSPATLPAHLADLGATVLRHPLLVSAIAACAAFLSGDYVGFLRFYKGADFLSAVALAELADLARVRQLWILSRAYPRSIGDVVKLSALVRLLAFQDEAHARAFLVFHGLVVENGLDQDPEGDYRVFLPKKGSVEEGPDALLLAKFAGHSRSDIVLGHADPRERFERITSPKFLEADRKPRDWKQVKVPEMDDWFSTIGGLLKKKGYRPDQEGDRFEVLNRKGVPFSLKDQRLVSREGRRCLVSADFPLLVNIKEWKISELRRQVRLSGTEERKSQVAIQKQIEQLKKGRPGKLLGAQEQEKLKQLRETEARLQVQRQEVQTEAELHLKSRASVLLQAVIRGKFVRLQLRRRHRAARTLQRGWRGYLARLRVLQMRELAKQRVKQIKHVRNAESLFEAVHDRQEAVAIRVVRDKDFNPFGFRHRVSQQSLLHAAAQEGLDALCAELVKASKLRGIPDFAAAKDWRGWTALHVAAQNGEAECLKELLQCEDLMAIPGCLGRNGQTALHVAALHGETEAVKVLLSTQSFEEEIDRRDRWGRTALHCACERGHAKAAVAIAEHPYFTAFAAKTLWGLDASAMASASLRQELEEANRRREERGGLRPRRRICTFQTPVEESKEQVGSRESVSSERRRGVSHNEMRLSSEVLQKAGLHAEARERAGKEVLAAKREVMAKATAAARAAQRDSTTRTRERQSPPKRVGSM